MFNKLKTIKYYTNEVITIEQLQQQVKNNPQQNLIKEIRSLVYKSDEYNFKKSKLNAITPHILTKGLKNSDIQGFTNYLFYDIDNINTIEELDNEIERALKTLPIAFLQKSVSNRGYHFLIKIEDNLINIDNFQSIYEFVFKQIKDKGFNLDNSAKGLSRKMIISSDEYCFMNKEVSLPINKVSLNNFISLNKSKGSVEEKNRVLGGNDTFDNFKLIDIHSLLKEIKVESRFDIEGYKIEEIDYYRIRYNQIISDGNKHSTYIRIMNALHWLNNDITPQQVYSLLHYMNKRSINPMDNNYLKKYVNNICKRIKETESYLELKTRKKIIHLDMKMESKDREKMGGIINGKRRQNVSISLIEEARLECSEKNIIPTQKVIQEMTGLGIATVKRNWNKKMNDLDNIQLPEMIDYKSLERDNKLKEILEDDTDLFKEVLSEEVFFGIQEDISEEIVKPIEDMKVITYKYKGYKEVTISITKEDKKLFKEAINILKENGETISYSLIELCGLDKYKLDYLYKIWSNKNI